MCLTIHDASEKGHEGSLNFIFSEENMWAYLPFYHLSSDLWRKFATSMREEENYLEAFNILKDVQNEDQQKRFLILLVRYFLHKKLQYQDFSLKEAKRSGLQSELKEQIQDVLYQQRLLSAYTFQQMVSPAWFFAIGAILSITAFFVTDSKQIICGVFGACCTLFTIYPENPVIEIVRNAVYFYVNGRTQWASPLWPVWEQHQGLKNIPYFLPLKESKPSIEEWVITLLNESLRPGDVQ